MGMIDITEKPIVHRRAEASGKIILSPQTIEEIKAGKIRKGDPLKVAEVSALYATKQTFLLVPHCHQICLDTVGVDFQMANDSITATCVVRAQAKTGVEMEALIGVSVALNNLWDMVKYLEKDEKGQYPHTRIADIRVISKEKKA